ncbi:MAG: class I SAM-dependent methyltransferase [Polyangiales bacterium]
MSAERYAFGQNWSDYVSRHFSEERVERSRRHMLGFLGLDSLADKTFLDIGSGSGLHSLAAHRAGAARVVSFDYDHDSVATTRRLWDGVGRPASWEVSQGSILDRSFVDTLPTADIVYSWGVLHHTGDQWTAIRNAASRVPPGGLFYISLYTSDAFKRPDPSFWLDVKRRYNRAGWLGQRAMEAWYIARFEVGLSPFGVLKVARRLVNERESRGMSFYTDVKDWLGGWPMEFSSIADVTRFGEKQLGLTLLRMKDGEATTEYLFQRPADG